MLTALKKLGFAALAVAIVIALALVQLQYLQAEAYHAPGGNLPPFSGSAESGQPALGPLAPEQPLYDGSFYEDLAARGF